MKISPLALYTVVEFDAGILILPAANRLPGRQARYLIQASLPICGEYVARYTHERAQGRDITEAHAQALKGARVIQTGGKDGTQGRTVQ